MQCVRGWFNCLVLAVKCNRVRSVREYDEQSLIHHLLHLGNPTECAEKLNAADFLTDREEDKVWVSLGKEACKLWYDIKNAWGGGTYDEVQELSQRNSDVPFFENWFEYIKKTYGDPEENIGLEPIKLESVDGRRFDEKKYTLPSNFTTSSGTFVDVTELSQEATFFGNYAPPDDLDGQVIDDAATAKGASVTISSSPFAKCVQGKLLNVREIHEIQSSLRDRSTMRALGKFGDKFVISDHVPAFFEISLPDGHRLSAMEFNMLAERNIPLGYYNVAPKAHTNLWHFMLNVAEPWETRNLKRVNSTDMKWNKALHKKTTSVEKYRAQVWKLRERISQQGSMANAFYHDATRQEYLNTLFEECAQNGLPDLIFFVEFGLKNQGALSSFLGSKYVGAARGSKEGRGGQDAGDSALILVQREYLSKFNVMPEQFALPPNLTSHDGTNTGKPIAGAIINKAAYFSLHAAKGEAVNVLKGIIEALETEGKQGLPVVIAGDFNAVIRNRVIEGYATDKDGARASFSMKLNFNLL